MYVYLAHLTGLVNGTSSVMTLVRTIFSAMHQRNVNIRIQILCGIEYII